MALAQSKDSNAASLFYPPWVTPPSGRPPLRKLLHYAKHNRLYLIPEEAYKLPILSIERIAGRSHMLLDPQGIRRVFLDNVGNYSKSRQLLHAMRPIQHSVFSAHGENWRFQRGAVSPTFQPRNLLTKIDQSVEAAQDLVARVEAGGEVVDFYPEMMLTAFDIICRMIAANPQAIDAMGFMHAMEGYMAVAGRATVFDFLPAPFLALKFNYLRTRHHWKVFHEIVETEVKAALDGQPSSNFVRNLIDARDKNDNRSLSFLQIRDNLLAFVVAGHETTALTLSWALLMLAHDQESQEKAREEVNETLAGSLDDIGDKLGRLPFCRQILDEAMRLYPPAPAISRRAEADDELVGVKIRKGESILIPISVIHRHQNYWDNPHAFWPDRFSGGHKFDRFLFIPFGAGPRICVGASMAYMSMEVILAALLAKFRFFPTDAMPQPVLLLTLRPRGGIPLKVERIR